MTRRTIWLMGMSLALAGPGLAGESWRAQDEHLEQLSNPREMAEVMAFRVISAFASSDAASVKHYVAGLTPLTFYFRHSERSLHLALAGPYMGVISDTSTYDDTTQGLAADMLGQLGLDIAIPQLVACLTRTTRPLTRFRAAVSLIVLGRATDGVPVVEAYVAGESIPEGPDYFPNTVMLDLFRQGWNPLTLSDAKQDAALNAFVVRLLGIAPDRDRVNAIHWLLRKGGAGTDEAFKAAEDILDRSASPPAPGEPNSSRAVVQLLEELGGERGRSLAARYKQ